jgi:HD-GYP domain-containing protein (c-di-GMP phosphodiesterase class II)
VTNLKDQFQQILSKTTHMLITSGPDEKQIIKFYERGFYLQTLDLQIEFVHIARWLDLILKMPVYAVYKLKEDNKLELFDKYIIQKNISSVAHSVNPSINLKDKKNIQHIIKLVEGQFTNLQVQLDWNEQYKSGDYITLSVGRCYYFPLFKKEKIWGIFVIGPYGEIPEFFLQKLSLLSEVITDWIMKIEEKDITIKKYREQNVLREIRKIGGFVINLEQIFSFLLSYVLKATNTTFALLADIRHGQALPVYSINLKDDWAKLFLGSLDNIPLIIDHELGLIYEEDSDIILRSGIHSHFIFPIQYGDNLGFLLIGTDREGYSVPHHAIKVIQEFCNVLSNILLSRESNMERIQNLMDIYFSMIRIYELMREKTQFHTPRMLGFANLLAKELDMNFLEKDDFLTAARYHDVGYTIALEMREELAIDSEYEHPLLGKYLLDILPIPDKIKNAVYMHEEWVNGLGYPQGIKGDNITWEAKLISVLERIVEFIEDHENHAEEETKQRLIQYLEERMDKQLDREATRKAIQMLEKMSWEQIKWLGLKE